ALEVVEVHHDSLLPEERAIDVPAGHADYLPPRIDPRRLAGRVSGKCLEIDDAALSAPLERVGDESAVSVVRPIREADDIPMLVDRHRRVPRGSAKIRQLGHLTMVPEDRVTGAETSHRDIAVTGNAHYLSPLVDRSRG